MPAGVLIVDDEPAICWSLRRALERAGYAARTAGTFEQGEHLLNEFGADAVLLDIRLPGLDGLAGLARLRSVRPTLPVIVMTAHGTLDTAVQAVGGGAFGYLLKPFALDEALKLVREATTPPTAAADETLVGRSPAMQAVFVQIATLASRAGPVLVVGEPGTGKSLVARLLHKHGLNPAGPFRTLDPDADAATLADGGTAELDGIDEWPAATVTAILDRTLTLPTPVRLVATARLLEGVPPALAARFGPPVTLPPLRDRPDDIALLAETFRGTPIPAIELATFEAHRWPGNVAELRDVVLTGRLQPAPPAGPDDAALAAAARRWTEAAIVAEPGSPHDLHARLVDCVEQAAFAAVLAAVGGNRWEAARWLGIHRATLRKKLRAADAADG